MTKLKNDTLLEELEKEMDKIIEKPLNPREEYYKIINKFNN